MLLKVSKAVLFDYRRGLFLDLWIRVAGVNPFVELRHGLVRSNEALDVLVRKFDLLHLLRNTLFWRKQREREQGGERRKPRRAAAAGFMNNMTDLLFLPPLALHNFGGGVTTSMCGTPCKQL